MIGRNLSHFRITARLGAGGMGEVYLAEDGKLKRRVALKILPPEMAADPERLARFRREGEALAALNHPNVVHVYSIEEAEGLHFLVMEVVEGQQLDELIPAAGLPLADFFELAIPLAAALAAVHDRGVTHRDLKGANILVDAGGQPKLCDFGLAKLPSDAQAPEMSQLATEEMTAEGQVLGTRPYMSPEQIEGKPVDSRSDVFSLGIVLFQMATGRRPFAGDSAPALAAAILRETPPSVTTVRPELPRHLGRIIDRCLEKDAADRFRSGRDVSIELERLRAEVEAEELLARSATEAPAVAAAPPRRAVRGRRLAGLAAAALAVTGLFWLSRGGEWRGAPTEPEPPAADPSDSRKRIVVLPFDLIGEDPEGELFADGLTEEMITVLGRANPDRLGVIARTSAIHLDRAGASLDEIGRQLGVDHVVEGSVRRRGDELRISAKLIQLSDETMVWSADFDGSLEDVFALQSDVAGRIAEALSVELLPESRAAGHGYVPRPQAYDAYLAGRVWAQRATVEGWSQAISHYERAVDLDPRFALARAGLADAYSNAAVWGSVPIAVARAEAMAAAREALRLDPRLAESHAALAVVNLFFEWDWQMAESEFRRALELNPTDGESFHHYSHLLDFLGRQQEAIEACAAALRVDPLSGFHRNCLAYNYISAGEFELADAVLGKLRALAPQLPLAPYTVGRARALQGRFEEAVAAWEEAARLSGRRNRFILGALGNGYGRLGRTDQARQVLEELERNWPEPSMTAMDQAKVLAGLGEVDGAFELLEEAYRAREPWIIGLRIDPGFEPLENDPRFEALLGRLRSTRPRSGG